MYLARRHAAPARPWWFAVGLLSAIGLTAAAVFVGVASFVARLVVTPPRRAIEDMRILDHDVDRGTITLTRTVDSVIEGRYGLWFDRDSGYAKVGDVMRLGANSVVRELHAVEEGTPRRGARCRLSGWYYRDPSELGVPFDEVDISTTIGAAPAWRVPAHDDLGRWVIQVHGRAVDRREVIRAVPVFRDAGFTSLLVSYRNDGLAPGSDDGLYALGDIEWLDVEAAIRFAVDNGAKQIILMGWSMGGATVLQAVSRSRLAHFVTGIVLESPVVDWVTALDHQAGTRHIPRVITATVYRLLTRPWGRVMTGQAAPIDLRRLDFVTRAMELRLPMLILHSDDDRFVPNSASRALAHARPDIVTFPEITGAGHTRVWNVDPERWTRMIREWLDARVSEPSSREPGA
ncbi:lysophospholipase [Salinibacterium sp. dk2585]|uniref:alpha/beta hydrolase family protein n=1 Tax=unclassified Salinibacterium TaxID=2632331 RepID=UPI0011C254C6|nr:MULTISPECIES: alpha/beta fold hydrolase [unclassified Salinibacterium]QEE61309.1 lysophospholipase [Salinibacterium sp. dk2585]TXK53985.1 alpha/beta hydrolase [Salinibacterium sp. dk5596]